MIQWRVEFAFSFSDGTGMVMERDVDAADRETAEQRAAELLAFLCEPAPSGRIVSVVTTVDGHERDDVARDGVSEPQAVLPWQP